MEPFLHPNKVGYHPYVIVGHNRTFKLYGQEFTIASNSAILGAAYPSRGYYTIINLSAHIDAKPFLVLWSVLNGNELEMKHLTFEQRLMVWYYAHLFQIPSVHPFTAQWVTTLYDGITLDHTHPSSEQYLHYLLPIIKEIPRQYLVAITTDSIVHQPTRFEQNTARLVQPTEVYTYYPQILRSMHLLPNDLVPQGLIVVYNGDIIKGYIIGSILSDCDVWVPLESGQKRIKVIRVNSEGGIFYINGNMCLKSTFGGHEPLTYGAVYASYDYEILSQPSLLLGLARRYRIGRSLSSRWYRQE